MSLPERDISKTSSQQKEIYLPQRHRGQGIRDKDRRQEDKGEGQAYLSSGGERDKGLSLARENTGVAHMKMVYKGKGGNPLLG